MATAHKTSISTGTSSSYMGTSCVSSRNSEIKREIEEGTVPRRSRRNKASTHSSTPLATDTSVLTKRRLNPEEAEGTRPRRRRINNSGRGTRKTGIKQERKTRIKQEFEDDVAVSLGRNVAPSYKNIADETTFPQEASDALFVEKKVAN